MSTTTFTPDQVRRHLRDLAILIGSYRLIHGTRGSEIDDRLTSLQCRIAEIANEVSEAAPLESRTKVGHLALRVVDSLIESEIRLYSPEVYDSVRDTGAALLTMITSEKQAA